MEDKARQAQGPTPGGDSFALPAPAVRWRDDGTLESTTYADVYHSADDGLAETRHVFLAGNDLPFAWQADTPDAHAVTRGERPFTVLELGFGTGRNALATWDAWRRARPGPTARLHYVSIEAHPLPSDEIVRASATWPELATLAAMLAKVYPRVPLAGVHRLEAPADDGVTLTLWFGDARSCLRRMAPGGVVDAWYLDGFAPARNPEMWRDELFREMARLSRSGATFATYSAAGAVRRGLVAAKFDVEKAPGFGRKRDMLRGRFRAPAHTRARDRPGDVEPWADPSPAAEASYGRALILGAGIAGCAAAEALARRGWAVTVVDPAPDDPDAGRATDAAGVVMPRLDASASVAMRWHLASNRHAWTTLARLHAAGYAVPHDAGGVLMLIADLETRRRYARVIEGCALPPQVARLLPRVEASDIAGVTLPGEAMRVEPAGWVDPSAWRAALLRVSKARMVAGHVNSLLRDETDSAGAWRALAADGAVLAVADVVVVANAMAARDLAPTAWLPLRPVAGVSTWVPAAPASEGLRCPLLYGGFVTPARAGRHLVGATYRPRVRSVEPAAWHDVDHAENERLLAAALPTAFGHLGSAATAESRAWAGRAGVRATTPDRLPVVGPVVDRDRFVEAYASLRQGPARRLPSAAPYYVPGLYALVGLGSRGLATATLAAELLASEIAGELWPAEHDVVAALLPHRFLIRDLRRGRL